MSNGNIRLTNITIAHIRTLALLCLCSSSISMPASAQSLQRLFSTPEQRIALDHKREIEGIVDSSVDSISIPADQNGNQVEQNQATLFPPNLEIKLVALGGSVLSSDGSYTVWINGQPYNQHSLPHHMQLIEPFLQGQLKIYNADKNLYHQLKPGQVLDLDSGKVVESFNRQATKSPPLDLILQDAADSTSVTSDIGQTLDAEQDGHAS